MWNGFVVRLALLCGVLALGASCRLDRAEALPQAFAAEEFWALSETLSETPGTFEHSDNLVSNEGLFVETTRLLDAVGGVYIGVGPEQNFSYIAALRSSLAFIVDIRRENRNLHLLYKVLFESSGDRAEFVSRLFSRPRVTDVSQNASARELFRALDGWSPSAAFLAENVRLVRERLALAPATVSQEDLAWIADAYRRFFEQGPEIRYAQTGPPASPPPTYRALMTATDIYGRTHSFLADDVRFAHVKAMHHRNLIVPVVGNFAGEKALRAVGNAVRQRSARLAAFYASNVEVYLTRDDRIAFCRNLAALPHDAETWFLTGSRVQRVVDKLEACRSIRPSLHWP